jgi:aryl-phospho-beta-D-glucosidase BglC (GH1 family)
MPNGQRLSAGLAPLATAGTQVIDAITGAPVRLRGVNRSGLEYSRSLAEANITRAEMAEIVGGWNANIVRLPFNQDFAFHVDGYLDAMDQAIAWAAESGAYTLLDLQWLDADRAFGSNGDLSINRVAPLPDPDTIALWTMLAERYRDEPAVLFDLFNEPHHPLPDDSNDLYVLTADGVPVTTSSRRVGMREWQPWARRLIAAIRGVHPAALIFVAGTSWAYDLRGFPLVDPRGVPLANIVYNTHVYPWVRTRTILFEPWEADWHRAFGHLASRVPVFAGEWGGTTDDLLWGQRLLAYFEMHNIGWTAWSWADWPHLVVSARDSDYAPTPFGELVRHALGDYFRSLSA